MNRILISIIFLSVLLANCNENPQYETNMQNKVYNFKTDGFVPDDKTAIEVAKAILPPIYGRDVLREEPFTAKLVGDSVWYVDGSLDAHRKTNGGTAHIEIRKKDCTILKVIHGK